MTKPIKPSFDVTIARPGSTPFTIRVVGRVGWCILALMQAGATGCTPISRPAPRWSHYVFRARSLGINIETVDEDHGGAFAGQHAKYVLRDPVTVSGGNLAEFLASPEGRREFGGFRFGEDAAA